MTIYINTNLDLFSKLQQIRFPEKHTEMLRFGYKRWSALRKNETGLRGELKWDSVTAETLTNTIGNSGAEKAFQRYPKSIQRPLCVHIKQSLDVDNPWGGVRALGKASFFGHGQFLKSDEAVSCQQPTLPATEEICPWSWGSTIVDPFYWLDSLASYSKFILSGNIFSTMLDSLFFWEIHKRKVSGMNYGSGHYSWSWGCNWPSSSASLPSAGISSGLGSLSDGLILTVTLEGSELVLIMPFIGCQFCTSLFTIKIGERRPKKHHNESPGCQCILSFHPLMSTLYRLIITFLACWSLGKRSRKWLGGSSALSLWTILLCPLVEAFCLELWI